MIWNLVQDAWNDLANEILADWPELAAGHMASVAGDPAAFAQYLADTQDLTLAEAKEAIEDWILRFAKLNTPPESAAA